MSEFGWWYLYIQILQAEGEKRKEISDLIEALLPWINPELWAEVQKRDGKVRENVAFENQIRSMFDGTWDPDPSAEQVPFIDELAVSEPGSEADLVQQMFNQYGQEQPPGTIRSQLFPGVPPTFRGPGDQVPETIGAVSRDPRRVQSSPGGAEEAFRQLRKREREQEQEQSSPETQLPSSEEEDK